VQAEEVSRQQKDGDEAMKISNSKRELARIICENGEWRDGEFAAQERNGFIYFYVNKPHKSGSFWQGSATSTVPIKVSRLSNWHQSCLSRAEYFHLYQAPDADGWIELNEKNKPIAGSIVDVIYGDGRKEAGVLAGGYSFTYTGDLGVKAFRPHKPEQAKPEFCKSVMRSIQEPESKPAIEQLASDYRNAKDYAERKQEEADNAKADADAKLKALELAGEALGLLVAPITAKKEPELAITDWRDLRVGDEVKAKCYAGVMIGFITEMEPKDYDGERPFRFQPPGEGSKWCTSSKFRFIRRP
jgi:hypothetical protein